MSTQQTPPPRKFIIQMSGAPGSGKSTLASLLGSSTGAVVIDHDRLRSALTTIPFDQAARFAYNIQWDLVQHFAQQGHNIVIDSTCNYPEVLDRGSKCAAQHGCAYWYVECRAKDINLLDRRLRARNSLPSQRTAVDSPPQAHAAVAAAGGGEDQRAVFRKWMEDPCRPAEDKVIIVDSTGEPEQLRDQVLARMLG
ncbi:P-loop containing nucleoside triphosphate hydrolase protein [Lactarius akahatsu]|uniref:P-loop containing nucleoside triphosphate hydrolase protein n=1 Tax=Lactarius akahatsu TaxID=416441 RepID=A0AAD4L424_9AGAM|nr:P-loop containing nucleoside triphosphate hydrolase protein [Lactarius akahatsu]